ncbi:hypothetical protein GHT06_006205 [Daphnia sinensis]|uniref:Ty3 transposon capsid-like protein domain-containing protein n=1 Tax=Daphnia sinensis TaxID=1820382 RepID=A0AAD5KFF0_9CRUS|nr:hypothetical protein GHT06_006205 [Daphnia sinensis]
MGNTHDDASRPRQQTPALSTSLPLNSEEQAVMNLTQPIVRVLGELFSREDKKLIPPFKGKSTDKLITEWLKIAEHVARNNNWNDEQKIRFFSDRLKGEALEWHETYVEENDTNYDEWKAAIIKRFQDAFDLAALKKKLFKLKQKPEENCRTFVSRLNNLYDTIEGKEEKLDDHDKTIMEDQLYNTVKRMRDSTKMKIFLQGILPKVKTELYLRMPEKSDDFESLCKQLFISEQILHEKESNEDKEITAVIAGITTRKEHTFESNAPLYSLTFTNAGINIPLIPIPNENQTEDLTAKDHRNLEPFIQCRVSDQDKVRNEEETVPPQFNFPDFQTEIVARIKSLFEKHEKLFADKESDLGLATQVKHFINTGNHAPIYQRLRRTPEALKETVKSKIDVMLKK